MTFSLAVHYSPNVKLNTLCSASVRFIDALEMSLILTKAAFIWLKLQKKLYYYKTVLPFKEPFYFNV